MNQAVLSEVLFESLPQLIAITLNEIYLRGYDKFAGNFEYQVAASFSTGARLPRSRSSRIVGANMTRPAPIAGAVAS